MFEQRKTIDRTLLFPWHTHVRKSSIHLKKLPQAVIFIHVNDLIKIHETLKFSGSILSVIRVFEEHFPICLITDLNADEAYLYKQFLAVSGPVVFKAKTSKTLIKEGNIMGVGVRAHENVIKKIENYSSFLFSSRPSKILPIVFGDITMMRRARNSQIFGVRIDRIENIDIEVLVHRLLKFVKGGDMSIS